jgi:chaperone BCS1
MAASLPQLSIMDILLPGFTSISAAFQQLVARETNTGAQLLCYCGLLIFFGKPVLRNLQGFVETHFGV